MGMTSNTPSTRTGAIYRCSMSIFTVTQAVASAQAIKPAGPRSSQQFFVISSRNVEEHQVDAAPGPPNEPVATSGKVDRRVRS
jgi:hypothetical protein